MLDDVAQNAGVGPVRGDGQRLAASPDLKGGMIGRAEPRCFGLLEETNRGG